MNQKFASKLLLFVCLSGESGLDSSARAQIAGQIKPSPKAPVIFTTAPKMVEGKLKLANSSNSIVRGLATLTVVKANENDSLTGTLVYLLPDETRQKIAQSSGRKLTDIPTNITQKELTANFHHGTACPMIKLLVSANDAEIGNATLHFDLMMLEIPERPNQINQLFCSWTRQINTKRQRLGIIAAINRLITIDEEDVENKTAKP